ncbi:hypothetical protein IFM89_019950 [Coptis chinensis]|uniref:F-box protein n=1 Tax=Coptis chinensis TaxID=261450 RepID=A0A835HFU5_9MAGN|nr:hypothetical protein IFM89_019950 [Coptis chinensis]
MADWSALRKDLLGLIARRLMLVSDHIRFAAVCSSWRLFLLENRVRNPTPQQYPGLVFPGKVNNCKTRHFFEPVRGVQYDDNGNPVMNAPVRVLLVPHKYYVYGSSLGCLVLIDDLLDMQLINPLSGTKLNSHHQAHSL